MCHARSAKIAAMPSVFEQRDGTLTIRAPCGAVVSANAFSEAGRMRITNFLTASLNDEARFAPSASLAFQCFPGHSFCGQRAKVVSLINLASLHDFEAKVGARRHRWRFRANVWFSGAAPCSERDWIGWHIQLGGAVLRITKCIVFCPATGVNPITAERYARPVAQLRSHSGHTDSASMPVLEGGRFARGNSIEMLGD